MKRAQNYSLVVALLLVIFLHASYMSGLYYDQDEASYVNDTLTLMQGKGLYASRSWSNKPPGIDLIFLAAFALFGKSFISIQIFALLAKIFSVILLYLFAKYLLAKEFKLYFLLPLFYALFSTQEAIQSHTSNLEVFLVPFEIAGVLFLGIGAKDKKGYFYFLSGFSLGFAFLVKPSAAATVLACLAYILASQTINKEPWRLFLKKTALFASTFLTPLFILCALLLYSGAWKTFVECVFTKNVHYVKNVSLLRNAYLPWSLRQVVDGLGAEIIIFGALALVGVLISFLRYKKGERLLSLSWFIVATFLISLSGFHLRHHFIEIVPPFLVLSVIGVSDIYRLAAAFWTGRKRFFLWVFAAGLSAVLIFPYMHLIAPLIKERKLAKSFFLTQRYLNTSYKEEYAEALLAESYDAARRFLISQFVKEHSDKNDKIFVWDGLAVGSVYLWSGREGINSVTKFGYLPDRMLGPFSIFSTRKPLEYKNGQHRLLKKLQREKPAFIIVIQSVMPMPAATYSQEEVLEQEKRAFRPFFGFLSLHYRLEKKLKDCFVYKRINEDAS